MRLAMTEEMRKMWEEIEPYLVDDKDGCHVSYDAPERIKEIDREEEPLHKQAYVSIIDDNIIIE